MSSPSAAMGRAVAADLLQWLSPLRFAAAADESERREAYRLRYQAVVDVGMAATERFPDGLERDEFDAEAVQVIGWDGDRAVATCRVVFAGDGRRFPLEAAFALDLPHRERTAELGRVTIDPRYRGDGHRFVMGLAARSWLAMESCGATVAIGVTPERLVRFFDTLGFPVTVLGPAGPYWGETRVPIACDGAAAAIALARLWGGPAVKTLLDAEEGGGGSTSPDGAT